LTLRFNRALPQTFCAGQNPAEDGFDAQPKAAFEMSQPEQVAMRPNCRALMAHHLVSQLVGFLFQVPPANRVAKATAPTAQSIHILGEVEQVGADAADLGQVLESQSLGFRRAVSGYEGQRKHSRVVLRRATAVADLNDAVHGT
jgi:hypothetical protein